MPTLAAGHNRCPAGESLTLIGVFVQAYAIASEFTLPVVISQRFHTGDVECGMGTATIINDEGWLATAAHMLDPLLLHAQQQSAIAEYEAKVKKIMAGPGNQNGKQKRIRALSAGQKRIANISYWWGMDGWSVPQWHILPEADLALGKVDGFNPAKVAGYPTFRKPSDVRIGASVCRLGFPFHEAKATYDEKADQFTLEPGTLPAPRFPNEGIVTRFLEAGTSSVGIDVHFLETSSPGLRGQSGGPIFDTDGRVLAIQSQTTHLPLGFSPEVDVDGRKVTEHQFLNVGVGVHSETVIAFATLHGVTVAVR